MTWGDVRYQSQFSHNFNYYGQIGVGVGGNTIKVTPSTGSSSTEKINSFGLMGEIGFPIHLINDAPIYLTPNIGYRYITRKYEDYKEKDGRFQIGLDLETYLPCRAMSCDCHNGMRYSSGIYNSGNSYLGFSTKGALSFGHIKTEYDSPGLSDDEEDYNREKFEAEFMYYVFNSFALGIGADFHNSIIKSEGFKSTSQSFAIMPMFEINAPVNNCWHNAFIRGGYGIGSQKEESTSGSITNTVKFTTSEVCLGLGYNIFFSKKLSFTPVIGYDWTTIKLKDTDFKDKENGLELKAGLRAFLGRF